MKHLARIVLRFFVVAIPVVIAACYGMAYRFSKRGKVIDASSKAGVDDVTVKCDHKDTSLQAETATTYGGGTFYLDYDVACDSLSVTDPKARYLDKTIPYTTANDITIEIQHR